MSGEASRPRRPPLVERALEGAIFASRWLLAPVYVGLVLGLVLLLVKFGLEEYHLFANLTDADGNAIMIGVLDLIDVSLMANLLVMVIFAGYEGFVSRLDVAHQSERLEWMGQVGFGDLKLKLMASIVAISAVRLLEAFMNAGDTPDRTLAWLVGIHLAFVASTVLLALMERLAGHEGH